MNFGNFGNYVSLPIFKLERRSLAQNKGKNMLHSASPRTHMKRFHEKKTKMQKK
jgi:hypothetical protein